MRVLVTGGTGYLGRAIVGALVRRGHAPIVFARAATAAYDPSLAFDGDIRDEAAVREAAAGCDAICHTAALVKTWSRRPAEFDEVNVGGFRHVLRAAAAHLIPRIVYTSSFLALPPNGRSVAQRANAYQRSKVDAHRLALEAVERGAPVTIVHPGVIYGPGARTEGNLLGRLIADHLAGRLPGILGADRLWSFAFVDDVAEGHVAALERGAPGARYGLGGENAPQIRAFEIVRALTGRPLPRRLPFLVASAVGLIEECRAAVTGRPPRLTRGAVAIFKEDWALDSRDAARDLGYRITPLEEGIRRTLAALANAPLAARRP